MHDYRLDSKATSFQDIPIVDIGPLIDGSGSQQVAQEIGHICEHVGFLYIKNHGVSEDLIKQLYDLTEAFFALPEQDKMQLHIAQSGQALRGYIPMYAENVDPKVTRDFKECFDFGLHQDNTTPFFGPNQTPNQLPLFATVLEQYHQAMMALGRKLVSAIAISLDLPADYFAQLQKKPITIQRLLHYPPQTGAVSLEEIGIGAHTDYGFLTILSQDSNGGLQVKNRAGEWVDAPPVEGTFIVNIGDLVQTLTNDRYRSTFHRVVNRSGRERYSIPFFMDLDFDAEVKVVPGCATAENPSNYLPYTCGQHKFQRFVDSFEHLQTA